MSLDDVSIVAENVVDGIAFCEKLRKQVHNCPFPILQLDCDNIYYNALVQREQSEPESVTKQLFTLVA